MRIDILTLFPAMFDAFLSEGIVRIAREKGLVEVVATDIRSFADNKWGKVDDRPYGGGPGMVMQCGPLYRAVEAVLGREVGPGTPPFAQGVRPFLLTPQGRRLDQRLLAELAAAERVLLVCGRYEGFDERVVEGLGFEELSIGDYVLSGGEPAAMVVIDGVVRLIPGALGHEESAAQDSFSEGLLEGPQYTRPPGFRGMAVPEVLVSGHHGEVAKWRREQALKRTREWRPDLLEGKG
ncbi:MAG TPA: tRNA (guanosine(37)-N1)-methyltransferase TrmD [Planctomycetota bacterium]|nr:tRNA (guanosine(37)-N1)-methyltransferase TrmD [Planctomycetota bacterium]